MQKMSGLRLKNYPHHLVFWWIIPCKAISGVVRDLATRFQVTVVCAGDLSAERKQLGWESPDFGNAKVMVLPDEHWQEEADRILETTRDALHVFDGVHAYERILYPLRHATQGGIQTAVVTEAHSNAFTGPKWLAKEAYARLFLPLKTRPIVRKALFALCLSGSSNQGVRSMCRLGWKEERIYPFGYFSEQPETETMGAASPESTARTARLLCTGYLTRNKGHHVLLTALKALKEKRIPFTCDITGYGPEEASLRAMAKDFGLDYCVGFRGVLPTAELGALMNRTDVFVAPGLREPWGIRINEAIQAGLAVVLSDGIGACELVKASGCGAVFRSGDGASLAESLASLLRDPVRLADCRTKALKYREHIHPQAAARYFEDVLRHTFEPTRPRPTPPWL